MSNRVYGKRSLRSIIVGSTPVPTAQKKTSRAAGAAGRFSFDSKPGGRPGDLAEDRSDPPTAAALMGCRALIAAALAVATRSIERLFVADRSRRTRTAAIAGGPSARPQCRCWCRLDRFVVILRRVAVVTVPANVVASTRVTAAAAVTITAAAAVKDPVQVLAGIPVAQAPAAATGAAAARANSQHQDGHSSKYCAPRHRSKSFPPKSGDSLQIVTPTVLDQHKGCNRTSSTAATEIPCFGFIGRTFGRIEKIGTAGRNSAQSGGGRTRVIAVTVSAGVEFESDAAANDHGGHPASAGVRSYHTSTMRQRVCPDRWARKPLAGASCLYSCHRMTDRMFTAVAHASAASPVLLD